MRRTEAIRCADDQVFKHFGRYEAAEFSQLEAAELLGVGERTFRRWRERLRTKRGRFAGPSAGQGVEQASSTGSQRRGRGVVSHALRGFTAKHFHEHL